MSDFIPLKDKYENEVVPALMKEFGYKNRMAVPRIDKVVINMGMGEATRNKDIVDKHAAELTKITGQKAVVIKAKRSVANFKLREGMPIGAKVTLRSKNMYNFLYKTMNIVLPRLRDFRGITADSFDGRGNYNFGLSEQVIFPELRPDEVKRVQGMDIAIVTTAKSDNEAKKLLELLGFPFKR